MVFYLFLRAYGTHCVIIHAEFGATPPREKKRSHPVQTALAEKDRLAVSVPAVFFSQCSGARPLGTSRNPPATDRERAGPDEPTRATVCPA